MRRSSPSPSGGGPLELRRGSSHYEVAVIGGGIAGLSAAHRLSRSNRPLRVVLLEQADRLGGKICTEWADGFLLEAGPDSFVVRKGSVVELAKELGIVESLISTRPEEAGSYVWSRGRLHPLPEGLLLMAPGKLRPVLAGSLLSWRGKLRLLTDLVAPRRTSAEDESLESFVRRRLGQEVLERIAEPLVAGIHAAEPSTMSLRASFPRFPEMEQRHRSLIRAARAAARQPPSDGEDLTGRLSYFASFRHGMAELPRALVRASQGVELRTGQKVNSLRRRGRDWRLEVEGDSGLTAGMVIVATPAQAASHLLEEEVPEAAGAAGEIRQVSTTVTSLAYRKEDLPPLSGHGFVVPAVERKSILGISYLSRKWEGRVPDGRFELLRAFVGGPHNQELAMACQDRVARAVRAELAEMLEIRAEPELVRAHRWPGGLHQYTLGHLERVARAERAVEGGGIFLAGGAYHGIGLNECIESGRRAAEEASSYLHA